MAKWNPLSETGLALVRKLTLDSRALFRRRRQLTPSLRALIDLGETASIPWLLDLMADDDSQIADEASIAAEALFRLVPRSLLPGLDEWIRIRGTLGGAGLHWNRRSESATHRVSSIPPRAVPLGLMASHGSGYVRQAAVARLDQEITTGDEIPFLLLRLNDWVPSVKNAAEMALMRRLTEAWGLEYLRSLELIACLKGRRRIFTSPLMEPIENLLQNDLVALATASVGAATALARRYGLALALENAARSRSQAAPAIVDVVAGHGDPGARLQLAAWLAKKSTPFEWQRQFLPGFQGDRYSAVRRTAIGWCAVHQPPTHPDDWRSALLDESQTVRSIAQFHLSKSRNFDLHRFYLNALCLPESRTTAPALSGLAETGKPDDAALILPFVQSRNLTVRRAAMGALGKLDPAPHRELFIEALLSPHARLSRLARQALVPLATTIGATRLATIHTDTPFEHVRRNALSLINRLPKWQKLPLLIIIGSGDHVGSRQLAKNHLASWLVTYNKSHHTRPTSEELSALHAALDRHGSSLDPSLERELRWLADRK